MSAQVIDLNQARSIVWNAASRGLLDRDDVLGSRFLIGIAAPEMNNEVRQFVMSEFENSTESVAPFRTVGTWEERVRLAVEMVDEMLNSSE